MCIITSKEFRADPNKYFDLAEKEPVIVTRHHGKPIRIDTVEDDDIPSPEELESIQRGLDDLRNGRTHTMLPNESLDEFLDRIGSHVSNRLLR